MLHFFSIFLNTAKLLDGEFCHMFFSISDFLDESVLLAKTGMVFGI